jgi:hypothetical protein
VRVLSERPLCLPQRVLLRDDHLGEMIIERVNDRRHVDPRPVELGESVDLVGFGIRQRQGVAAAAVEGARQMHDLGAQIPVASSRFVLPALPVECDLEGVLHRQRAAFDEEQVRERGIAEHSDESLDELGIGSAVHVRVRRLVGSDLGQLGHERRIVDDAGRVDAKRSRGKERVHVEVAVPGTGIDHPATSAAA